jgi:hypothetical protein
MKMIDSNKWAPRHKLNLPMGVPIPITNPPVDHHGLFFKLYFAYSRGFYYRLSAVIYNTLHEDNYFDEDN